MKTYRISLLVLPLCLPLFLQLEMESALQFLETQKNTITEVSQRWDCPSEEVLAIVSPELIRYHLLQDFLETQALEISYINFGTSAADFSIGRFQMKPSFIEKIEVYLSQNPDLQKDWPHISPLAESTEKAKRQGRLMRLKDFRWQLEYAAVFYQICLHRFEELQSASPPARVAFLATAYNYGFDEPEVNIQKWQIIKAFPYGKKYQGEQAAYADLAVAFYHCLH